MVLHWFGSMDPYLDLHRGTVKSWVWVRIETNADPQHCKYKILGIH
jgi:hypothetical protein